MNSSNEEPKTEGRQLSSVNLAKNAFHHCIQSNKGVTDLRDGSRMNFGAWNGKIPIPRQCLGRWKGDPSVIDGRNAQADVSSQDDGRQPD